MRVAERLGEPVENMEDILQEVLHVGSLLHLRSSRRWEQLSVALRPDVVDREGDPLRATHALDVSWAGHHRLKQRNLVLHCHAWGEEEAHLAHLVGDAGQPGGAVRHRTA